MTGPSKRSIIDSMIVVAESSAESEYRNLIIDWLEFQTDLDQWGRVIFKPANFPKEEPFKEDSLQSELFPAVSVDDIRKTYGK